VTRWANRSLQRTAARALRWASAAELDSLGVKPRYVATLVCLLATACSQQNLNFGPFEHVTRIEVRHHGGGTSPITSPAQIASVVGFANQELAGWKVPWAGVPVPDISADLYSESTFLGHLGVGPGFLETQRDGTFLAKFVSSGREHLFRNMLSGVPEIGQKP
jgi:hypothetical protein